MFIPLHLPLRILAIVCLLLGFTYNDVLFGRFGLDTPKAYGPDGIRPAINVGISVSRVGGSAQVKSMKKVSGTLKLDQAQYRELEAFSKFGSELDAATQAVLDKGARNVEILKQAQNAPLTVQEQIAIIYCGVNGLLMDVPVKEVKAFEAEFLELMKLNQADALADLAAGKLSDSATAAIKKVASELSAKYKK